jgi:hypothetical protein
MDMRIENRRFFKEIEGKILAASFQRSNPQKLTTDPGNYFEDGRYCIT